MAFVCESLSKAAPKPDGQMHFRIHGSPTLGRASQRVGYERSANRNSAWLADIMRAGCVYAVRIEFAQERTKLEPGFSVEQLISRFRLWIASLS